MKRNDILVVQQKEKKTYNTLVLAHTHSRTHDFPWSYTHLSRFPLIYKCSDRTTHHDRVSCYSFSPFRFFFFPLFDNRQKKKKKKHLIDPSSFSPTAETWSDFNQWAWFVFLIFPLQSGVLNPPRPPPSHPPSSHIKNISKECIYFSSFLQLADLARTSCPTSKTNKVRGWIWLKKKKKKSSGTFPPAVGGECLVNKQKRKNEEKKK